MASIDKDCANDPHLASEDLTCVDVEEFDALYASRPATSDAFNDH
jgi:hypothetical protein